MKKGVAALLLTVLMIFSVAGCGQNDESKKEPIQIGTKKMTEQYILGEMLGLLIEAKTDYDVEIKKGLGAIDILHQGMKEGDIDLYPEYTSTGWVNVLKQEKGSMSDDAMFEELKKQYSEQFGMTWVALYGFNNTYTLTVRKEIADQYNLRTTSDMAAVSENLVFGANADYIEREDGYQMIKDIYGLNFKDVKEIDIGLKYHAMDSADVDVINGYTTDAQLGTGKYIALEDDKGAQVNYFCSTIVREDVLENYEGLEEVLNLMEGLITDAEMAGMNYQVEVEQRDEAKVAAEFLQSKGLID